MIAELSTSVEDFRPVGLARLKQNEGHVANAGVSLLLSKALELLKTKMDKVTLQFYVRSISFSGRRSTVHRARPACCRQVHGLIFIGWGLVYGFLNW